MNTEEKLNSEKRRYRKNQLSYVVRYIAMLPPGQIFTTRELLQFVERRAPLDYFLCMQVKSGVLERLARGVFRRFRKSNRIIPDAEISGIKRFAFAGRCLTAGSLANSDKSQEITLYTHKQAQNQKKNHENNTSFVSLAGNSNFLSQQFINFDFDTGYSIRFSRIKMKAVGNRKSLLGETRAGRIFRDIWLKGEDRCTQEIVSKAYASLSRKDRQVVASLRQFLPQWISDKLPLSPSDVLQILLSRPANLKNGRTQDYKVPGNRFYAR
ncbi:MAG: hypothetical protein J0M35_09225 [Candidatus Obscuribacter phosphatis]|uniref:Uncharacterized protein n=1 Tax=Candidatus Obscuribacter phosphatis TaxID=1906157 RepID=A0A8J7TM66_9BACT|nr:hypothetical protein [Candidatus Obscuribacter phosphatis]